MNQATIDVVEGLLASLNEEVGKIVQARDDVVALLRIHTDITSDAEETSVLSAAKVRAKTAATALVTLLS